MWRKTLEEKSGGEECRKNCTDEEGESGGVEWRKMVEGSMKGQWRRGEWRECGRVKQESGGWGCGAGEWRRRVKEESEGGEWKTWKTRVKRKNNEE